MRIIKVISLMVFFIFNLVFNIFEEKQIVLSSEVVSIGVVDLPKDLVYLSDESYVNNVIIGNLFEGLVNLSTNGDVVSGIAERFVVSDDQLEYRFYIRNDAYFSNGDLITAKDFYKFFNEIVENDKDRFYYSDLKSIVGIEEFYNGEVTFENVGIKFNNMNCLIIELKEIDENFLKNLAKDKFSLRTDFKYLYNYKDFYEYVGYSGPYIIGNIQEIDDNIRISLKPNKYYYLNNYKTVDQKLYSFASDKEVILEVFKTREFAIESYKTKKLDLVLDVPYNVVENYFESDELYYLHNNLSKLVLNLNEFIDDDNASEVSFNIEEDESNERLKKGNFINFLIDIRDTRYINGIDGEILRKYIFDKDYISNKLSKFKFDGVKSLKIVTHSDDNYIELARKFKEFLLGEFNIQSNIVAMEDNYILNELTSDDYDILISHFSLNSVDGEILSFDKPSLVLSTVDLNSENIDGNGTLVIKNIN